MPGPFFLQVSRVNIRGDWAVSWLKGHIRNRWVLITVDCYRHKLLELQEDDAEISNHAH